MGRIGRHFLSAMFVGSAIILAGASLLGWLESFNSPAWMNFLAFAGFLLSLYLLFRSKSNVLDITEICLLSVLLGILGAATNLALGKLFFPALIQKYGEIKNGQFIYPFMQFAATSFLVFCCALAAIGSKLSR
ncbi:MAG: hypothetical protein C0609_09060 [Deltaproteobacteria bacterium]|nr:MAG: hypothetical protein C0609_09060 [Deltaproteobacteria bacterium]